MSSVNNVVLVGRLTADASIHNGRDKRKTARMTLETFRPFRDKITKKSSWEIQRHRIVCDIQAAMGMIERCAKKGAWFNATGMLRYDSDTRAEVAVSEAFGTIAPLPVIGGVGDQVTEDLADGHGGEKVSKTGKMSDKGDRGHSSAKDGRGAGLGAVKAADDDKDAGGEAAAEDSEPNWKAPNDKPSADIDDDEIPF